MPEATDVALAPAEPPAPPAAEPSVAPKRKLGVGGWICVVWLGLMVLVGIFAPMFTKEPVRDGERIVEGCGDGTGFAFYDPFQCSDLSAKRNQAARTRAENAGQPVPELVDDFHHIFGVDASGRDIFSQVVVGTRTTLIIAFGSIAIATVLGGALGLVSGYVGGKVDTVVTGLFDVMIAFPPLVLALLIINTYAVIPDDPKLAEAATERRIPGIILALVVVATPILGRIARASTLTWSGREFVMAAKALGAKPLRIMLREVLPNVAPAMMSISMLGVGLVIVTESSLSLIGLGVPSGKTSWGSVIAGGAADLRGYPHQVFVPSVAIVVTICALNFLGDALRQKFDVRESAI